jgi:hypothetical protein
VNFGELAILVLQVSVNYKIGPWKDIFEGMTREALRELKMFKLNTWITLLKFGRIGHLNLQKYKNYPKPFSFNTTKTPSRPFVK